MHATTIAVDLAKSVFQISIANQADRIIDRKRLTRSQFKRFLVQQPPTHIVMEACATAHHWSRFAQEQGHQVKQLHPYYVKPYVRHSKTDAADADALIRANQDPHLLPIPIKSPEQQALQGIHRVRQQFIQTHTQRINLARALLAENGCSLPSGTATISHKLRLEIEDLPLLLHSTFMQVINDIDMLNNNIDCVDRELTQISRHSDIAQRLMAIPGIGVITSTALIASVPDINIFKRGRQFAAWLGITLREHSSGNLRRLGRISKQGNPYLRTLLIHGARSVLLQAHRRASDNRDSIHRWVLDLEQNKHRTVGTVALANKLARIVWATWTTGQFYSP